MGEERAVRRDHLVERTFAEQIVHFAQDGADRSGLMPRAQELEKSSLRLCSTNQYVVGVTYTRLHELVSAREERRR